MTIRQPFLPIVPIIGHEHHILIHFLLALLGKPAHRILERLLGNLLKRTSLASLGLHLAEPLQDIGASVVVSGGEHALAKKAVAVCQNSLDELTRVVGGVEKGDGRVLRGREAEYVFARRGAGDERGGDVGHIEARHEECGRDGEGADVFFHLGFGVEVVDIGVIAVGDYLFFRGSGER